MLVSQKCRYALRAMLELAKRDGQTPAKIAEVAKNQAIPPRFLENILAQLKQGGFVESVRGKKGGYLLARAARTISVGEIIRYIEGSVSPVNCTNDTSGCEFFGDCVFLPMWDQATKAAEEVYDNTFFDSLAEKDHARQLGHDAANYCI